jgi:aminoglycoside phosphotransferase (APT) family kinase protein
MLMNPSNPQEDVLRWCADVLGPLQVLDDHTREHPGLRASITRLRAPGGDFILKSLPDFSHWESEVHAYEHWAAAFGAHAPRLIAVREEEPHSVLISALPGTVLEETTLADAQQIAVWRAAGQALAGLHNLPHGEFFGPVRRDGSCAGERIRRAEVYMTSLLDHWLERGARIACLAPDELAIVQAAREDIPAFAGEQPTACHRDYCSNNWLVTRDGTWSGVIDFEFAYWDVRAADFTRYPNWEWIDHPERIAAFFEGYGRPLNAHEEEQRLVCHVQYALAAVVWGMENEYFGYAAEGRRALAHLRMLV